MSRLRWMLAKEVLRDLLRMLWKGWQPYLTRSSSIHYPHAGGGHREVTPFYRSAH